MNDDGCNYNLNLYKIAKSCGGQHGESRKLFADRYPFGGGSA